MIRRIVVRGALAAPFTTNPFFIPCHCTQAQFQRIETLLLPLPISPVILEDFAPGRPEFRNIASFFVFSFPLDHSISSSSFFLPWEEEEEEEKGGS